MSRFLDAANLISLAGLCYSLAAALLAIEGMLQWAMPALIAAGLCTLLDGVIARGLSRTDEERRFGARLNSLVNVCSFGIVPTFFLHASGMKSPLELMLIAIFAASAVWRLAYFDAVGLRTDQAVGKSKYVGLPVSYVALIFPTTFLAGFAGPTALRFSACCTAIFVSAAMLSRVPIPKPGRRSYGLLLLITLLLTTIYAFGASQFTIQAR